MSKSISICPTVLAWHRKCIDVTDGQTDGRTFMNRQNDHAMLTFVAIGGIADNADHKKSYFLTKISDCDRPTLAVSDNLTTLSR